MRNVDFLHLAKTYIRQVNAVMLSTEKLSESTRQKLRTMGGELLQAADNITPRTGPAHMARKAQAKHDYENEHFRLHWRSSEHIQDIIGWEPLALFCNLSVASLRSMFSQGRGKFTRVLYDDNGNADNVTLYRVNYVPGNGRPKHVVPEMP